MAKKNRNDYKPTGVLAVDMVAKCKAFYDRQYREVKEVYLRPDLFKQFSEFVKRTGIEHDGREDIDFDDTKVKCGHVIGDNPMIYYLNKIEMA